GVRQCIQNYENIMRIRASRDVLGSRSPGLIINVPKSKYKYLFKRIYLSGCFKCIK
ncbi:7868_t:CDS:1, partial [Funneliformis caledonium]